MKTIKSLFDPFELLYLAVAIATFEHTAWAAAFLFEGPVTQADSSVFWWLRGSLIAIAVDVGMLMTSRYLQTAKSSKQKIVLAVSFFVAALTSFYSQVIYITYHTPQFALSDGVSSYWRAILEPVIEARVVLLPFALPMLATIYTIARLFRHYEIEQQEAERSKITTENIDEFIKELKTVPLLESGENQNRHYQFGSFAVNLEELYFVDEETGKMYSNYKNQRGLTMGLRSAVKKKGQNNH